MTSDGDKCPEDYRWDLEKEKCVPKDEEKKGIRDYNWTPVIVIILVISVVIFGWYAYVSGTFTDIIKPTNYTEVEIQVMESDISGFSSLNMSITGIYFDDVQVFNGTVIVDLADMEGTSTTLTKANVSTGTLGMREYTSIVIKIDNVTGVHSIDGSVNFIETTKTINISKTFKPEDANIMQITFPLNDMVRKSEGVWIFNSNNIDANDITVLKGA